MAVSKRVSKKYDTKTWTKYHAFYAKDIDEKEIKELEFYLNFEHKNKSEWMSECIKNYLVVCRNHYKEIIYEEK